MQVCQVVLRKRCGCCGVLTRRRRFLPGVMALFAGTAAALLFGYPENAKGQEGLTPEEANRPWEQWTIQQIQAKGWTPYDCASKGGEGGIAGVVGNRWPKNDPTAARKGACVSYSFEPYGTLSSLKKPSVRCSLCGDGRLGSALGHRQSVDQRNMP